MRLRKQIVLTSVTGLLIMTAAH